MKNKLRAFTVIFLIFFVIMNIIPVVFAKTRKSYLTDFILKNEIQGEGFKNGIDGTDPIIEATAYALEILDYYSLTAHKVTELEEYLETKLETMFEDDQVILYDLYYILKSLDILDYSIEEQLKYRIYQYLNQTEQIGGGFSFSNSSTSTSLSSTFFVIQVHSLIGETISNVTVHKDWVLSCNNSDGGYGNNIGLSSSLLNTYYAVAMLRDLDYLNDLVDKNQTLMYLNTFYVQNPSDSKNNGGYIPDLTATYALLSSTYYCVKAISIIESTWLNNKTTTQWVLSRQYFEDGGFADLTDATDQLVSSVISSYYAFETLKIFDSSLSKLSSNVFMVEFNFWILVIIMASIGLIAGIGVIIWRRRRI